MFTILHIYAIYVHGILVSDFSLKLTTDSRNVMCLNNNLIVFSSRFILSIDSVLTTILSTHELGGLGCSCRGYHMYIYGVYMEYSKHMSVGFEMYSPTDGLRHTYDNISCRYWRFI